MTTSLTLRHRAAALVTAVVGAAGLLGIGAASASAASTATKTSTKTSTNAFVSCMESHGVPAKALKSFTSRSGGFPSGMGKPPSGSGTQPSGTGTRPSGTAPSGSAKMGKRPSGSFPGGGGGMMKAPSGVKASVWTKALKACQSKMFAGHPQAAG